MKLITWMTAAAKAAWHWWDGLPAPEKEKLRKEAEEAAKKMLEKK